MAQNTASGDEAQTPITDRDLEGAADGHYIEVDELRHAVAQMADELDQWADEIADTHVPEDHGEFGEPTVIAETDEYVCIYVEYGTLGRMAADHPEIPDEGDVAQAVAWAHNEFARRHGADPDALGTMDAVVLPRTERVTEIIADRE